MQTGGKAVCPFENEDTTLPKLLTNTEQIGIKSQMAVIVVPHNNTVTVVYDSKACHLMATVTAEGNTIILGQVVPGVDRWVSRVWKGGGGMHE